MTARMRITGIVVAFVAIAALGVFLLLRQPEQRSFDELHDVLTLQNNQISSFDPLDAYHAGHIQMCKQLYNTLVDVGPKGQAVPSVARDWTTEDGLTWRFRLRDDVLFHADACFTEEAQRRVTADDVVFTFERLLSPTSKSMGVSYFTDIVGATDYHAGNAQTISGLRIIDPHTLEIKLGSADFGFPARLTLPYASIVPVEAVTAYGAEFAHHPVGSGPFRLERYETNTLVSLVRNPDYWEQGLPALATVNIHLVADEKRAILMFRNGEVDFLELSRPLYEQYRHSDFSFDATVASQDNAQINM